MADRPTAVVRARVLPSEHPAWQAKAAAAGVSPSDLLRQAMARTRTWTARGGRLRARTHPAGRPHRQQAEPDHAVGDARRGRRGQRPPGRHRAGDRAAGPIRRLAAGCTSSSSPAAPARLARRPTICSASGTWPRNRARVSRSFPVIRNRWRLSLTRWSSSKYRSAVIAWSRADRPTDAQIEAVLDEFDKTAWAGLDADRYSWTAVLHRDQGGGSHAHVLTARCDPELIRDYLTQRVDTARCRTASTLSPPWRTPVSKCRARARAT